MKNVLAILTIVICSVLAFSYAHSQGSASHALILTSAPNRDSLWSLDPNANFNVVVRLSPTIPGNVIEGINGIAFDPCEFKTYVILKLFGDTSRTLARIDPATGICTPVGSLGDKFSSITFRKDGQLFGVTGHGASIPETLYLIDKLTGAKTLAATLGSGLDGEIISYNHADNFIYHWFGSNPIIFEKILPVAPYTVTNIPVTGITHGEVFGALHWNADTFLISNINHGLEYVLTNGTWVSILANTLELQRGLVMPPVFALQDDSVCVGQSVVHVFASGVNDYTVIYNWGDNHSDTIQSGSGTHTYTSTGNFHITVLLDYGVCQPDTFWTKIVHVNNPPVVTISGFGGICPGDSVTLTGTAGGTSQWYFNGAVISGANTHTYTATVPGIYNMIKTNLNGCSDSATVGKTLINVNNPVISIGNDTTECGIVILDASHSGSSYLWNDNSTNQTLSASVSGTYYVQVTDTNNCIGTDTIHLVIHPNPLVTLTLANDSVCSGISSIALTGGLPTGGTYFGNHVIGSSYIPSTPGTDTIYYAYTDGNGCKDTAGAPISVFTCLGIHDLASGWMELFPNPSDDYVTLVVNGITGFIHAELIDLSGRTLEAWKDEINSPVCQHTFFHLSDYAAGNYVVNVTTKNGSVRYKLVIR